MLRAILGSGEGHSQSAPAVLEAGVVVGGDAVGFVCVLHGTTLTQLPTRLPQRALEEFKKEEEENF